MAVESPTLAGDSIAEKLRTLKIATADIKQAIIDKGGVIEGNITTWANAINNIQTGGDLQPTANIIQNKLNGGTIGELGVRYDLETVLHQYIIDTTNILDYYCIRLQNSNGYSCRFDLHNPAGSGTRGYHSGNDYGYEDVYWLHQDLGAGHKIRIYRSSIEFRNPDLLNITAECIDGDPSAGSPPSTGKYILVCVNKDGTFDFDTFNITLDYYTCYIKDTNISLYNGITKKVQDVNYNDELLVWNFDECKFDKAKPLWIKKEEKTNNYYKVTLDNNITIGLVGSNGKCHRLFDYDNMVFTSATDLLGKNIYTLNGVYKITSIENIQEVIEYYNIITDYHMNCFANGILTSCRYNNLYPIQNMKFDKSNIISEPRWKIHQDKFKSAPEILSKYIRGMRLDENQTIPLEEMKKYIINLENRKKTIKDFEENFKYEPNIEDTNIGWISPNGEVIGYKLYMTGYHIHEIIAKDICEQNNIERTSTNYSEELEKLGFIKYSNIYISYNYDKDITKQQEKCIKKFLRNNKHIKNSNIIKIDNYHGENINIQELINSDKKHLSQKIRRKHNKKNN